MTHRTLIVLLASLATASTACDPVHCDGCGYEDPEPDPVPEPEPEPDPHAIVASSCLDLVQQAPTAADDFYALEVEGRSIEVFCADMGASPAAYLPLSGGSFAQYTAGSGQGTNVRTDYEMVRIDLESLTVDMADSRFARSAGSLRHGDEIVEVMPFGVAMSCSGRPDGAARVDLRGTGLALDDAWQAAGAGASGSVDIAEDGQVADIRGGGNCGWAYPGEAYNPFNDNAGFDLQLRWIDEAPTPVSAASCAELRDRDLSAKDGTHTLAVGGRAIDIHCADMQSAPKEYLPLSGDNFAQYTAGGSQGSSVRTDFDAVRIDLRSLKVDMGDLRFTSSKGSLRHGSETVNRMPYGVAMSCTGSPNGAARIDLRGTPLAVNDTWRAGGASASGEARFSQSNQVVDVVGGGYCGWTFPGEAYNPFNDNAGFDLQLAWR